MTSRRFLFAFIVFFTVTTHQVLATVPTLLSAVSRQTHGSAGVFDVQLPLTGGSGIECRNVSNGITIVATFDQPVQAAQNMSALIAAGTASIGSTPVFSNYTVSVVVKGLVDAEAVTVALNNISNAGGEVLPTASIPFRTLFGDVDGDGLLSSSDASHVRTAVASNTLSYATFRCDLNTDGLLSASDYNREKAAIATGGIVAGGATNNTPPTISQVLTQSVVTGTAMTAVGFTIADNESAPPLLAVVATSSDTLTIPNNMISISGTGASRTVSVMPSVGVTAITPVTITMYVSDGLVYSTAMTFVINVTPPPVSYLASLAPIAGTNSLGSGTAVLTVSGDQTYAIVKYGYANIGTITTDDAIYDSTNALQYDMPVGRSRGDLQADGSLKWTFATAKQAAIVQSIQSNSAYILVNTPTFPNGELQGTFKLITGSQIFTPPASPPAITINPPSAADASRFLQQAAFGGNSAEIAALSNASAPNAATALNDWLTAQFKTPLPISPTYASSNIAPSFPLAAQSSSQPYSPSSTYAQIYNRVCTAQSPNAYGDSLSDDRMHEAWWKNAVSGADPLRQRVATALSEFFVVSEIDSTIDGNIPGLASYYDMLADDAFGNFRQILGDVTLHPIMGHYLTMAGNNKTSPNENYAREIMQLFTIGLYMLNPDGTLQLDTNGSPIPTYSQPLVTSFAAVYTGWNYASPAVIIPTLIAPVAPATTPTVSNFSSSYQTPLALNYNNHSTVAKTLLSYPGVGTFTGASQPGYIPANTSQSVKSAGDELNFALDNIFNHPNVGPFVCKQLIQRLVESNPSPGYIYRVAQVFNNDGTGVRGNMQAVITAILTDYEARSPSVQTDPGYGHMREPMIRMAQLMHSLNAVSKSTKWAVGKTDSTLNQTILRSPTVFNFFDPNYAEPGPVQTAGLVSPELDIIYETTITNAQNMIYTGIYANYNSDGSPVLTGTGWRGDSYGSDVYCNFSPTGAGLIALDQGSGGPTAMLNQVVLLINGGPLDSTGAAQGRILNFLNASITGTTLANSLARVEAAVHLVATSSQAAAER